MRKCICPLIAVLLVICGVLFSTQVLTVDAASSSKAKTLAELRKELKAWKAEQKKNDQNKTHTKNEISSAKNSVSNKQTEIQNNQKKIQDAIQESVRLDEEILKGKGSLQQLLKAYQLAKGDNVYLEYIFEATSYEDLIYRYAIMEQIMDYQENKITEWQDKIEYNTQLKADLTKREGELNQQIDELADEIDALGNKLDSYFDISMDIKDEIASTEELIHYYETIGCEENEKLDDCVKVKADKTFIRPLNKGLITSKFGYRTHPVTGQKKSFHTGTDMGGNSEGTSVYSVANGTVSKIIRKSSCGGNQVYIYHTVNGKKYTSAYLHLLKVNVKVGQKVTNTTVIGTVGGGRQTYWDKCSTGAHLHFGLGTGWYGADYASYNTWKSRLVDPEKYLKLPGFKVRWYSRY